MELAEKELDYIRTETNKLSRKVSDLTRHKSLSQASCDALLSKANNLIARAEMDKCAESLIDLRQLHFYILNHRLKKYGTILPNHGQSNHEMERLAHSLRTTG